MITNIRTPLAPDAIVALVVMLLLLMTAGTGSTSAQGPQSSVSINSYSCPADYDQVSDCTKIGGVTVRVLEDEEEPVEVTTVPESPAGVNVAFGANVTVEVIGGAPTGSVMEPTTLQFEAVEGANPVTLVFVDPGSNDADGDGLSDADEATHGTDPNDPDSDADGIQDGGEINAGTDPLDEDTDDDGHLDLEELDNGSDPLDPDSVPVYDEPNSLSLIAYNCPAGYEGKDLFEDCTTPAADVDFVFYLNASEWGVEATTNASGAATFGQFGSGQFTLQEDVADLGFGLQRYSAVCFAQPLSEDAPEPRQVIYSPTSEGAYSFELGYNEHVECTWFNIPAVGDDTADPKPTPTPASPVKRLPSTGSGPVDVPGASYAPVISGAIAAMSLIAAGTAYVTRRKD